MRSIGHAAALIALTTLIPLAAGATDQQVQTTPEQLRWGPAPPTLPQGAEMAVLSGDPAGSGPYVMRLRLPDGYRMPPHWHSQPENLSVLSGTYCMGMGDREEREGVTRLGPGGFAMMPDRMRHYGWCEGGCMMQIHGTGPFDMNY